MFYNLILATLLSTIPLNIHGAFLCKKAKIATTLATAQRFKYAPLRTLIYQAYSTNPLALYDLTQVARECTPATEAGKLPNIKSLDYLNDCYKPHAFVYIGNPIRIIPSTFMFDSIDDIKMIVDAANPDSDTPNFKIAGFANIKNRGNRYQISINKDLGEADVRYLFYPKSHQTVLKWYALNSRFVHRMTEYRWKN